jgi:hypothetical protein
LWEKKSEKIKWKTWHFSLRLLNILRELFQDLANPLFS